jgi:hypothetical protein
MSRKHSYFALLFAVAVILCTAGFGYKSSSTYHRTIARTNEREIKATIEAGFAKLILGGNPADGILEAEATSDKTLDLTNLIQYSVRDKIGYLTLTSETSDEDKKHGFHFSGFESSTWTANFTSAVPISFDIQLGLGKGDFDFSEMQVKDLSLSAGASSVRMRFDKPNKSEIENLNIEAGLSKFEAHGLGNAHFRHLKFEGGVGSYLLDFKGDMSDESDADITVGLGSLMIDIPRGVGVKIVAEKNFVTHFDIPDDFSEQREDHYVSSNYYSADAKLNMHIDAGVGSVKIRWQ